MHPGQAAAHHLHSEMAASVGYPPTYGGGYQDRFVNTDPGVYEPECDFYGEDPRSTYPDAGYIDRREPFETWKDDCGVQIRHGKKARLLFYYFPKTINFLLASDKEPVVYFLYIAKACMNPARTFSVMFRLILQSRVIESFPMGRYSEFLAQYEGGMTEEGIMQQQPEAAAASGTVSLLPI